MTIKTAKQRLSPREFAISENRDGLGAIIHGKVDKLAGATEGRLVTFILSDETPDRHGDVVLVDGWDLSAYKTNPIVLVNHKMFGLPVGKMVSIGKREGALRGTVQFATMDESPEADTVYKLLKGGYLNAGSVGFTPIEWKYREAGDYRSGIVFEKSELYEFSVVSVPANPNALVQAKSAGIDVSPLRPVYERMLDEDGENPYRVFTEAALKGITATGQVPVPVAKEKVDGRIVCKDYDGNVVGHIEADGTFSISAEAQAALRDRNKQLVSQQRRAKGLSLLMRRREIELMTLESENA